MLNAKALIRGAFGVAFGAALLFFILQKVDLNDAAASARNASPAWILIGVAFYAIDITLRVERWRRLIRPTLKLSYPAVAEALIVGYAMNNLLPARLGEVFRADYISRRQDLARSAALGSIAIERLMDGVVVVAMFILGLVSVSSVSRQALHGLTIIAVLAVVGLLAVMLLIFGGVRWHTKLPKQFAWLEARVAILARSICSLSPVELRPIFVLSLAIWLLEAQAIDCMMRAFGVAVGWAGLCLVVGAASLSALLPSAPGYVGSLQVAFVLAFSALGISEPLGLLSATATQIFLLGAITLGGLSILLINQFHSINKNRTASGASAVGTRATLSPPIDAAVG